MQRISRDSLGYLFTGNAVYLEFNGLCKGLGLPSRRDLGLQVNPAQNPNPKP